MPTMAYATFHQALEHIASQVEISSLRGVILSDLLHDSTEFQQEIFAGLKKRVPTALNTALQSSGNLHNPAMIALQEHFADTVLLTPTVKQFEDELKQYGLSITAAVYEKLVLPEKDGRRYFAAMLWLMVEKHA